jgi:hypothetical protein
MIPIPTPPPPPQVGPYSCRELNALADFFELLLLSVPRWLQGMLALCS